MLSPAPPLSSRNLLYLFRFSFNPPHMLPYLRFIAVTGRLIELLPVQFVGEILLLYIVVGIVMGIFIARAPAQLGRSLVMGVLEMGGDGQVPGTPHLLHGGEDARAGRIALGRASI